MPVGHMNADSALYIQPSGTMSNAPSQSGLPGDLHGLIARYRARCLWFLKEDYHPSTPEETIRVLKYIERYGDREAFITARRMRQWLLRNSSAGSAGS